MFIVDKNAPTNIVNNGGRSKSEMRVHIESLEIGDWLHTSLKANGKNGTKTIGAIRRTVQSVRKNNRDMRFRVVVTSDNNIHVNRVK